MEALLENAMKSYVAAVDACFKEMAADYAAKKVGSWADRATVAGKPAPTWKDAVQATNTARSTPHPCEYWGFVCHEGTFTCEEVDANMIEDGERYRVEEAWKRADAAASAFVKERRRARLRRGWKDGDDYRYGRD